MLANVLCFGLSGIDGFQVRAEVNVSFGLPGFEIVGLPDAAVRESRERIKKLEAKREAARRKNQSSKQVKPPRKNDILRGR